MSWLPISMLFFYGLKLFSMYLPNAHCQVCVCVCVCRVCSDGRMELRCHLVHTKPDANLAPQQDRSRWELSRTLLKLQGWPSGIYQRAGCRGVCSKEVKSRLLYSPCAFLPGVTVINPLTTDFWQHSLLVYLFTFVLGLHAKKADFPLEITPLLATAEKTLCSTDRHVFMAKKHLSVRRLVIYYTSHLLRIVCACFMSIFGARWH